jgi:hypothetical protein
VVGAGRRLHVRLRKPERPSSLKIYASKTKFGPERRLQRTLRPVEQDGKTVGWEAFFRVGRPDSHYYLDVRSTWDEEPLAISNIKELTAKSLVLIARVAEGQSFRNPLYRRHCEKFGTHQRRAGSENLRPFGLETSSRASAPG